jgi:ABC-type uncharacterized transport system permease subunit
MIEPSTGQLILLGIAVALFAAGLGVSAARAWKTSDKLRVAAKVCTYLGILCAVGVIVWHGVARGQWLPVNDNFESLLWLGVLLALFVMYTQRVKPVGGLDWFVMPIAIVLLIAAGVFGRFEPQEYRELREDLWMWVHRVSAYGGALAFAVAAAGGTMYVVASRRLRSKTPLRGFGSLERIEHLTMVSVTVGFALLTVGLVTGFVRYRPNQLPVTKLALATLAWLVYAVVLHAPINPRFRGRRAAMLSVFGFALMVGTMIVVLLIPGTGGNG